VSANHAHLDAETLAAWMDGGLDASSSAAAEAHVSNCERCQAMVAVFVRTEAAGTLHAAPGTQAPGTLSLWRWWLAPIAATAAAVTIWMVMPPQTAPPNGTREPAAAVEQKADATAAPAAPPAEAPPRRAEEPQQKVAGNSASPGAASGASDFARPPSAESASARASSSARAPSTELRRDRLTENQSPAGAPADRVAKLETTPRAADSALSKPSAEGARPAAQAPALAETITVAPAAPPALAASPPVAQLRAGPFEIVSPSPAFRWRVDARGSIERSEDGGRAWFPIRLGGGETLTAGSSPSQNVCWLVGGRGVVLIAVDGVSFVRLPFPLEVDLIAVTATDGRTATVTASDRRTFTTTDSGRTWK
jgi:hypothetical protein